ncbi:MAG TPA: hypothetical protein VGK10_17915 [Prolixibacteraceae bacterium]|jgi:hypothetical protein
MELKLILIVNFVRDKTRTIMNAIDLKSDLHSLIDKVNDTAILNAIKTILSAQVKENDLWEELPLNVQESVKRGIEQARSGKTKAHSEVMKSYEKWL